MAFLRRMTLTDFDARAAMIEGVATAADVADARADLSNLRVDVFHALRLQAATIIAVVLAAILAAAVVLANLLS